MRGLCCMKEPDCLEQPWVTDSSEMWVQFMHWHLYQWQAHPGLILNQCGVSLLHLKGFLLLHQQIPSGLTQRQKAGLHIWIIEVLIIPGLYCSHHAQLKVIISIHCEQWPMSNMTDNMTIDNIIQHLAFLSIPDHKVREAHHYTVEWLRSTAASTSRPEDRDRQGYSWGYTPGNMSGTLKAEEAAEASTIYQQWQQHTNLLDYIIWHVGDYVIWVSPLTWLYVVLNPLLFLGNSDLVVTLMPWLH